VITVDLPPLRSRREDIPMLATHFLKHYAEENNLPERTLSPDALRAMVDYDWPGNVRELENAIERGVVLSLGPVIGSELLPGHLTGRSYSTSLLEHNPDASLFDILEDIERRIIVDKLERCNWNQTDAAEQFRIPLSTLNQKIKRLSIEIRKRVKE
jgi:DNA-binding NtrC family response regulator